MSKEKKEKTQKDFEKIQKQSEEYLYGWKRALADYENFKKQSEKEKQEFIKFANLNLIINLIPVYNNFKLALDHSTGDEWAKGIEYIKKQFEQILKQNGVEEILPKIEDEFDINLHEAIKEIEKKEIEELRDKNKISKIISCGYKLNGKVIVPARVIVN